MTGSRIEPSSLGRMTGPIPVIVIAALILTAFWPILTGICGSWFDSRSYMEHGVFVVPAAAYMAWTRRGALTRVPVRPSVWGLALVLWGAAQATVGTAAHWMWFSRTAFLISLTGSIAALYGFGMVRELAYPLATLILMIAPPTFLYTRLTVNLQLLASRVGEVCLEALGYSVIREGNIMELAGTKLSVEEACSGIRSLMAIVFMCVVYNYFFVRGRIPKATILILAVPIALIGNVGRIVATGIASQHNRDLVQGTVHEVFGYISVVIAGICCILVHMGLQRVERRWRLPHA